MKFKPYILFISVVLLSAKCRKEPGIIIDPCKDKTAFKADFVIEEKVGDTSYITDKALAPGYIYFKAKGVYDSVRWYIGGTQNTSTKKSHVLYFEQPEDNIEVTFIGYKKPDMQCFPNDKATDTMHKTLHILPRNQTASIVGRFLGYNTNNPADTFSVYINADNSIGFWDYFVKNLPKNCPGYTTVSESYPLNIGLNVSVGNSAFRLYDDVSVVCASVTGFGYLQNNDSLIIDYSSIPVSNPPVPYTPAGPREQLRFIGVRKL